ncbi:MAG TPA: VanZ family protein [Pseudogracilibacillus sp.]|nr:VanZ family protein [Pseudogracilibacillus sp.]
MKRKYIFAWLLVLIWMGCIFYLSHQPASESSKLSAGVMATILQVMQAIFPYSVEVSAFHSFVRKGAHFFAYFLLGILLYRALWGKWRHFLLALFIAFLYAVSDEVHQLFIPGRSGEVRDVLIDSAGAATGILLYILLLRLLRRWVMIK